MDKVVWCTGAGKGIGRATALELSRRGWKVAGSSRNESDLRSVGNEAKRPNSIFAYPLDVTDAVATADVIDRIESDLGPIELVILNAGTHIPMPVGEFKASTFRSLFDVNVFGVVHGLETIIPRFIAKRGGKIAVVSSVAGYQGLPTAAAYGATKAALINMCEALQPELAQHNVRLALINPGFVKTPLTDRNTFEMPFIISAERAAKRIVDGLETNKFEISFPWQLAWGLKLLRCLPYGIALPLAKRLVP